MKKSPAKAPLNVLFELGCEEIPARFMAGFLADLKGRGLLGKKLKLIVTDGNPSLLKATTTMYPFIKAQRCIAHKMRNVA